MTSEVLILNQENIILASDTRITINGEKTFDGANKIFQISNKPQMAMMIYGKPNITGVPFETTLHDFKLNTNFETNNTTSKISAKFIKFLEDYGIKYGEDMFDNIEEKIKQFRNTLSYEINNSNLTPVQTLKHLIEKSDSNLYHLLKKNNLLDKIPKIQFMNIITKYFKNETNTGEILDLLIESYISGIKGLGVVITGFNEKTIYPSYSSFMIYGINDSKLLYECLDEEIELKETKILPFAQKDYINKFLYQIDIETINLLREFVINLNNANINIINSIDNEKIKSNELKKQLELMKNKSVKYINDYFSLFNLSNISSFQ